MIDAHWLITNLSSFAVIGVALIIYFETATILGSFLPGDSLLFLLGLTLTSVLSDFPFILAVTLVFLAAIFGAQTGYWVGKKTGPKLFGRKSGLFFSENTPARVRTFFNRYGPRAIILARFVPVLRALIPMFVAISGFDAKQFLKFNVIGAAAWVIGLMTLGYVLGDIPFIKSNLETFIIGFVIISSLPLPIELAREALIKRYGKKKAS